LNLLEWTGAVVPQGQLVKTAKLGWRTLWLTFMTELAPQSGDGVYSRPPAAYQSRIGSAQFPAEAGRYVLYLGNPCPWCHRVLAALRLRGLEGAIRVVRAMDDPERASRGGWVFDTPEPAFGCTDLRQVYDACTPGSSHKGRCTAPLLVDSRSRRVVCNDSATIVDNLDALNLPGCSPWQLEPPALRGEIAEWDARIYEPVNNGVYKSGFATTQAAYDAAQRELWAALDALEATLTQRRFLCGDRFTRADLFLFPTAARFDAAYATLFKCSARRWADFPSLAAWLRDCAQLPLPGGGVLGDTVDVDDCRRSYFAQLFPLNPGGIVPWGPSAASLGWDASAGRGPQQAQQVFHARSVGAQL
jgi:putative glutathione S-transferase